MQIVGTWLPVACQAAGKGKKREHLGLDSAENAPQRTQRTAEMTFFMFSRLKNRYNRNTNQSFGSFFEKISLREVCYGSDQNPSGSG